MQFTLGTMTVQTNRSAILGSIVVSLVFGGMAWGIGGLSLLSSIITGIIAMILHWINALMHQYGHGVAARLTGYPMSHVITWGALSRSVYPQREDDLHPQTHIRRAIGGPVISLLWNVPLLILLLILGTWSDLGHTIAALALLDNIFIFTLGAVVPPVHLSWFQNDGGTIWHWLRKQNEPT